MFFSLVSSQALAITNFQAINFNNSHEWQLRNPVPEHVLISSQEKKRSIVIHVNRRLKENSSLVSDTIEFICGDNHVFYRAGATGSCDLPKAASASFGIKSSDFHNGSEGVIIFVE